MVLVKVWDGLMLSLVECVTYRAASDGVSQRHDPDLGLGGGERSDGEDHAKETEDMSKTGHFGGST